MPDCIPNTLFGKLNTSNSCDFYYVCLLLIIGLQLTDFNNSATIFYV